MYNTILLIYTIYQYIRKYNSHQHITFFASWKHLSLRGFFFLPQLPLAIPLLWYCSLLSKSFSLTFASPVTLFSLAAPEHLFKSQKHHSILITVLEYFNIRKLVLEVCLLLLLLTSTSLDSRAFLNFIGLCLYRCWQFCFNFELSLCHFLRNLLLYCI